MSAACMRLREHEEGRGWAEAHGADWDAERRESSQVVGDGGEGGALQVLELQRAMLKEADCRTNWMPGT